MRLRSFIKFPDLMNNLNSLDLSFNYLYDNCC